MKSMVAAAGGVVVAFLAAGGVSYAYVAKQQQRWDFAAGITGGNPASAEAEMRQHGCPGCHTIPGVRGPAVKVGPALGGMIGQVYIAGVLTNTPDNLVRWLLDPPSVDPKTAMPNTGLTETEARDIAAYLYAKG